MLGLLAASQIGRPVAPAWWPLEITASAGCWLAVANPSRHAMRFCRLPRRDRDLANQAWRRPTIRLDPGLTRCRRSRQPPVPAARAKVAPAVRGDRCHEPSASLPRPADRHRAAGRQRRRAGATHRAVARAAHPPRRALRPGWADRCHGPGPCTRPERRSRPARGGGESSRRRRQCRRGACRAQRSGRHDAAGHLDRIRGQPQPVPQPGLRSGAGFRPDHRTRRLAQRHPGTAGQRHRLDRRTGRTGREPRQAG